MSYSFQVTARVLLYASSHRQDNTYHSLLTPVMEHWIDKGRITFLYLSLIFKNIYWNYRWVIFRCVLPPSVLIILWKVNFLRGFFFNIVDVLYLNVFIIIFQLSKLHEALHVVLWKNVKQLMFLNRSRLYNWIFTNSQ